MCGDRRGGGTDGKTFAGEKADEVVGTLKLVS